jgi:hypothetical protein
MTIEEVRVATRTALLSVALSLALLVVGFGSASAGGNAANAKLCQKGGWQALYSTSAGFTSEEACVSYAASGGTLSTTPPNLTANLCAALGGTYSPFGIGPGAPFTPVYWSCGGAPYSPTALDQLIAACEALDPINREWFEVTTVINLTCVGETSFPT